jgi:integrase
LKAAAIPTASSAQAVLGHKDIETTRDYVHIFAALNKAARAKDQKRSGMRLIE